MRLVLASKSPRRKEILERLGLDFEVLPSNLDESQVQISDPEELVRALARLKAEHIKAEDAVVIGADVCVALDGHIFGQPEDKKEAIATLWLLSGKRHKVYGGICVICGRMLLQEMDVSAVEFRSLSQEEIEEYVASGDPLDKAGSYSIGNKQSAGFITKVEGSMTNILGLSAEKLVPMLEKAGISVDKLRYERLIEHGMQAKDK